MTWLVEWIGNHVGAWLGTTDPEPVGSMRATLRGNSSFSGNITGGLTAAEGGFGNNGVPLTKLHADDEAILRTIMRFVCPR